MKKHKVERLELGIDELTAALDRALTTPLSEQEHTQLTAAIETLAHLTRELEKKRASIRRLRDVLFGSRTEKLDTVLKQGAGNKNKNKKKGKKKKHKGHGRHGAAAYKGADRIPLKHESLHSADPCPQSDCGGKVYGLKDPGVIVRIKGMPPLAATVYELEKLRCNLCDRVFTAKAPEGIGQSKYDETAVALIAMLKYGAGFPFNRLEQLERNPVCRTIGSPCPPAPSGSW